MREALAGPDGKRCEALCLISVSHAARLLAVDDPHAGVPSGALPVGCHLAYVALADPSTAPTQIPRYLPTLGAYQVASLY